MDRSSKPLQELEVFRGLLSLRRSFISCPLKCATQRTKSTEPNPGLSQDLPRGNRGRCPPEKGRSAGSGQAGQRYLASETVGRVGRRCGAVVQAMGRAARRRPRVCWCGAAANGARCKVPGHSRQEARAHRKRHRSHENKQVYRSTPYVPTHRAFAHPPADAAHHSPPAPPAGPSARTPKMGPAPAASPRWAPVTPAQPSELLVLGSGCAGGEELVNSNPRTLEPMPRPLRRPPPPLLPPAARSFARTLCRSLPRSRCHV